MAPHLYKPMPISLVRQAIERSRESDPLLRAMVLLHGSRVLATAHSDEARKAFAEAVAIVDKLELEPRALDIVLSEAVEIGAGVDLPSAVALIRRRSAASEFGMGRKAVSRLVQAMVKSGDAEGAVELLRDCRVQLDGALAILQYATDPAIQRRAMEAARSLWRAARWPPGHLEHHEFIDLFQRHWQKLEPADQESWLAEILRAIETEADEPTNATFGDDIHFQSSRDKDLFQILPVLASICPPEEVAAVLARHPAVAKAAER